LGLTFAEGGERPPKFRYLIYQDTCYLENMEENLAGTVLITLKYKNEIFIFQGKELNLLHD
jgi:hypothetical protein